MWRKKQIRCKEPVKITDKSNLELGEEGASIVASVTFSIFSINQFQHHLSSTFSKGQTSRDAMKEMFKNRKNKII